MASSPSAFLDGQAAARAQPLVWWRADQLEAVASHVNRVWQAWAQDWLTDIPAAAVLRCEQAHGSASSSSSLDSLGARHDAAAWIESSDEPALCLRAVMFPTARRGAEATAARSAIAAAVADEAWAALRDTLCNALKLDSAVRALTLPPLTAWSGSVRVVFTNATAHSLSLLLNASCVAALIDSTGVPMARHEGPASGKLTPVLPALSNHRLSIQVEFEPCELDLGSLAGLHIGDIVPLPHMLDSPLHVSSGAKSLCSAFLGKHGGFRAVELVRFETPNAPSISPH